MLDGVQDIPLPGPDTLSRGSACDRFVPRQFFAGPENQLVPIGVSALLGNWPDKPPQTPPATPTSTGESVTVAPWKGTVPDQPSVGARSNENRDSPPVVVSPEAASPYNPLVLHGRSGTGKSHVARGLASVWKTHHRRDRVVCTTAVEFAHELADAIDSQAVEDFRVKYRTANLLIFEDLGHLATPKSGKLNAQEELIHTLDALLADDRSVVVTASAAPAELPGLLPALQSRLTAGLTIAMMPPGVAARRQILQHFASLKNVTLPEPVADVLAEGLGGTVPEIVHSLMQLTAPAELDGEVLDVADAKRYIAKGSGKQQPTMHEIGLATARHFRLRLADLRSPVRRRALVAARGVAIYLARTIAGKSFEEIGRYLGGRDHSTIMHSCRQTQQRCENDPAIHEAITRLRKDLWKK